MTGLNDRRQSFENKYANDLETGFRVESRAVRLFGLWVAGELELKEGEADLYADRLVRENLKEPGLDDVLTKVRADLNNDDTYSEHVLDVKLAECLQEAERQIVNHAA